MFLLFLKFPWIPWNKPLLNHPGTKPEISAPYQGKGFPKGTTSPRPKPAYPKASVGGADGLFLNKYPRPRAPKPGGLKDVPTHPRSIRTPFTNYGRRQMSPSSPFRNGLPKSQQKNIGKRLAAGTGATLFGAGAIGGFAEALNGLGNVLSPQFPFPTTLNTVLDDPEGFCTLTGSCNITDFPPFKKTDPVISKPREGVPENLKNKGLGYGLYEVTVSTWNGVEDSPSATATFQAKGPVFGVGYHKEVFDEEGKFIGYSNYGLKMGLGTDTPFVRYGFGGFYAASDLAEYTQTVALVDINPVGPEFIPIQQPPINPKRPPYNPAKAKPPKGTAIPISPLSIPKIPDPLLPLRPPYPIAEPVRKPIEKNPLTPPFRPPFEPPKPLFDTPNNPSRTPSRTPSAVPSGSPSKTGRPGGSAPGGGTSTPPSYQGGSHPKVSPPKPKKKCNCSGLEEGEEPMVVKFIPVTVTDPDTGTPTVVHVPAGEGGSSAAAHQLLFRGLRNQNTQRSTIQTQVKANNILLVANHGFAIATQTAVNAANASLTALQAVANKTLSVVNAIVNNSFVQKAINVMNLIVSITILMHLTRDVAETLADTTQLVAKALGLKLTKIDEDGNEVEVQLWDAVSGTVNGIIQSIIGADNLAAIQVKLASLNRIYHAASSVLDTTMDWMNTTWRLAEITVGNIGKVGNALKESRQVSEDAYGTLEETFWGSRPQRFQKLRQHLENVEDSADAAASVASTKIAVGTAKKEIEDEFDRLVDMTENANENVTEEILRRKEESTIETDLSDIRFGNF